MFQCFTETKCMLCECRVFMQHMLIGHTAILYLWLIQVRQLSINTVCHSVCIFGTHCSMGKPHCWSFRLITANFSGVWIFRSFTVPLKYCNDFKYSERRSSLIRVYTVCHSVCIFRRHYHIGKPHYLNFRMIGRFTAIFSGVWIFQISIQANRAQ